MIWNPLIWFILTFVSCLANILNVITWSALLQNLRKRQPIWLSLLLWLGPLTFLYSGLIKSSWQSCHGLQGWATCELWCKKVSNCIKVTNEMLRYFSLQLGVEYAWIHLNFYFSPESWSWSCRNGFKESTRPSKICSKDLSYLWFRHCHEMLFMSITRLIFDRKNYFEFLLFDTKTNEDMSILPSMMIWGEHITYM